MVGRRKLSSSLLALAAIATFTENAALAGNGSRMQIIAVTPDAQHVAVTQDGEQTWVCGLAKRPLPFPLPRAALEVSASCGAGPLLPLERWTWARTTPEVRALRPLTIVQNSANPPARIAYDLDTQLRYIEVVQQGTWFPVFIDESSTLSEVSAATRYGAGSNAPGRLSEVRGFVRFKDRMVVIFSNADSAYIDFEDDAFSLSDAEIVDVAGRFSRARDKARERSKALREQYAAGSGPFTVAKKNEKSRKRSQIAAVREALKLWEQARVFGSLGSAELRDALWLLAWLEAPTRRQEAMRLYVELRERDQPGAAAIVDELAADPATLPLATHLRTQFDPLRGLPATHGCSVEHLSDSVLAKVSNEELSWIHRAQWAARDYRFSDPKIQAYFEGFVWYSPTPKDAWRVRATSKFQANPDAPLLHKNGESPRGSICRQNLELILEVETARGLSPPSL